MNNIKKEKKLRGWLSLNKAVEVLKKNRISSNRVTFLSWVNQYNLGHKVGGRWVIYPERLEKFIKQHFHIEKIYNAKKKEKT